MFKYLESLEKYSNECAFRFLDGENSYNISFEKYLSDIKKCAYQLESIMGNVEGRHIALIGGNSYEYVVIMAALMFSRAVFVPLNFRETEENLTFAVKNAEVEYLIADSSKSYDFGTEIKYLGFDDVLCGTEEKELNDFTEDEADKLFMIVYTSGTTSLSKGVALSVGNIFKEEKIALPEGYSHGYKAVPGFKIYTNFPFYHIGGILAWITWSEHGCTMMQSVNPQNILSDLENESIDYTCVLPATIKLWLKAIRRGHLEKLGGAKIVSTAGAPVSVEDVKEIQSHGMLFGQYYGMTETGGNATFNFDMEKHIASAGRPYDDAEIKIIDGEICIKYWGNMMGYYKNEEDTKETLKDGLIYTGDLGYLDDEGYLYITGRKKNLIILSGGENISPEELENLLYKNINVKECKVFENNDRINAAIYAEESARDEIKEYVSELNKTLPIYKRIYGIEFQDEAFEKTASGKMKR
ncbi:class I adenylate-forming enzyme family protein [Butyrivibrio sp. AC2005]|uniref:class I adenylate-forming enzyme family protein n=1 Tax=Butyrivibrio sp. AC2005 TaxID=1280672 RepID=UPI000415A927|nr:class I adenylate-forming enzyme family protein [Butyrivibrio sp. AC2005]